MPGSADFRRRRHVNTEWDSAFTAQALAFWTPERTAELVGDKRLLVTPAKAPALLRAIGLLHRDASMPPAQRRKFFQLNHMLRLLEPAIRQLPEAPHIIDAGCGRSYLSLTLAWCFEHVYGRPVKILGVDRNAKLIDDCRRRADLCGLSESMRHHAAQLDDLDTASAWREVFGEELDLSMVLALHACDTATDDAIVLGVRGNADLIAVAPCCHAELARRWSELDDPSAGFAAIWESPHLRRETAASVTDALRMLLLRCCGYDARAIEFVPAEHTPKNTLIRAVRARHDDAARIRYDALVAAIGDVSITLAERLLSSSPP